MKHPLFCSNVEHIAYVTGTNLLQGYAYRFECDMRPTILSAGDKSSSDKTANCYIVATDETLNPNGYGFVATVAGNGISVGWEDINFANNNEFHAYPMGGGASISGNSVAVVLNQNNCISNVHYEGGMIYFRATGAEGNARVTLLSDNSGVLGDSNGVWTWHIWCTDRPATYTINGYTVMDRNLGAITNSWVGSGERDKMTGFYYPFGHYIGFTYYEYTHGDEGGYRMMDTYAYHPEKPYVKVGTNHVSFNSGYAAGASGNLSPDVWSRLWKKPGTNGKTMYDPCPHGYRVMTDAVFSNLPSKTTAANQGYIGDDQGFSANWYGMFVNGCFFPYSGKLYAYDDFTSSTPYEKYLFLWTNSYSSADKAVCYSIHRKNGNEIVAEDGGFIVDDITYGKPVRCIAGY